MKFLPSLEDTLYFGGAAAITYGAWLVAEPLGYVVGGILAVVTGAIGGVSKVLANRKTKEGDK